MLNVPVEIKKRVETLSKQDLEAVFSALRPGNMETAIYALVNHKDATAEYLSEALDIVRQYPKLQYVLNARLSGLSDGNFSPNVQKMELSKEELLAALKKTNGSDQRVVVDPEFPGNETFNAQMSLIIKLAYAPDLTVADVAVALEHIRTQQNAQHILEPVLSQSGEFKSQIKPTKEDLIDLLEASKHLQLTQIKLLTKLIDEHPLNRENYAALNAHLGIVGKVVSGVLGHVNPNNRLTRSRISGRGSNIHNVDKAIKRISKEQDPKAKDELVSRFISTFSEYLSGRPKRAERVKEQLKESGVSSNRITELARAIEVFDIRKIVRS